VNDGGGGGECDRGLGAARGLFLPNEEAAIKLLYMALLNVAKKWHTIQNGFSKSVGEPKITQSVLHPLKCCERKKNNRPQMNTDEHG
jgi:hypothetical protein